MRVIAVVRMHPWHLMSNNICYVYVQIYFNGMQCYSETKKTKQLSMKNYFSGKKVVAISRIYALSADKTHKNS